MGNRDRGKPILPVVVQQEPDDVRVPSWVTDHAAYRRWATSDEFPDRGQLAYLDGEVWVDTSMERLGHNQAKGEVATVVGALVKHAGLGHFLHDRMLLTNVEAGLSTEPDGMFISEDALRTGRVHIARGDDSVEVEGTPDMVLEVVSPASVKKDKVVLKNLYWRAKVREYWLIEPTRAGVTFHILRRGAKGYTAVRQQDGWLKSPVFSRSFRMTRDPDPFGLMIYTLATR